MCHLGGTCSFVYRIFVCRLCIFFQYLFCIIFFFFSSRRRHTRYIGDWSSDVCSSDLGDLKRPVAVDILLCKRSQRKLRIEPPEERRAATLDRRGRGVVEDGIVEVGFAEIGRASCRERV